MTLEVWINFYFDSILLCNISPKFIPSTRHTYFHFLHVASSHYFSFGKMKTLQKYILTFCVLSLFLFAILFKTSINVKPIKAAPKCGRFPKQTDIDYDNEMWQVLINSDGPLYLWNAYLDLRWNKSVVVNAIGAGLNQTAESFFCQYWYEARDDAIVVQAFRFQNLWRVRELIFDAVKPISFEKISFQNASVTRTWWKLLTWFSARW